MTSLHTIIPLEYIKQSEKLRRIECKNHYWISHITDEWKIIPLSVDDNLPNWCPAPSIADVINNAEILFWKEEIPFHSTINTDSVYHEKWKLIGIFIIEMCQQDKSIEEISQYIIDNIK